MNQSIIETLTTVSDALAATVESGKLASVAAQTTARTLDCRSATVWLLTDEEGSMWLPRLGRVPGLKQAVQRFGLLGSSSSSNDLRLHRAGTSNGRHHPSNQSPVQSGSDYMTLAALTDGQITTTAELASLPARAVQIGDPESDQGLCLVAGLFGGDTPIGLLVCTWDTEGQPATNSPDRDSFVCLANYLGQLFGQFGHPNGNRESRESRGNQGNHEIANHHDQQRISPERSLFLAGTALLLTALDVGAPATRQCAEAVTRSVLQLTVDEQLGAAQIQALQWAALFHEVGRVPIDHWLTFQVPDDTGDSTDGEDDEPPALSLIPRLEPAADLLIEVAPVLDGQADHPDPNPSELATLLTTACLSAHSQACRSSGHGENVTRPAAQASPASEDASPAAEDTKSTDTTPSPDDAPGLPTEQAVEHQTS